MASSFRHFFLRFPNGYGMSIIPHSYQEVEIAVLAFASPDGDRYTLVYDTPVTDDVLIVDVNSYESVKAAIAALPKRMEAIGR